MTIGDAHASEKGYDHLAGFPSDELFRIGRKYQDNHPDSAMICYSLVEGRYTPNMSPEEAKLCIDALIRMWRISFYKYYDYARAYECLTRAQEIAEEKGMIMPTIDLQLGILYQVISEQTGDVISGDKAFNYYRKGLKDAIKVNDTIEMDVLASNYIQHAFFIDKLDSVCNEWLDYKTKRGPTGGFVYTHNVKCYDGLYSLRNKEYNKSIAIFDSIIKMPGNGSVRYKIIPTLNKALVMVKKGSHKEAIDLLQYPLHLTESIHMKDGQIEIYDLLSCCYGALGNDLKSMYYENKSLRLKDSVINYSQLTSLEGIKSGRNIRKYQERLVMIEAERKMQRIITVIIAMFFIVVTGLLIILFNRNRRLKHSNKVLYEKNIDILHRNEKEFEIRREYERRLEELSVKESYKPVGEKLNDEKTDSEKYKGSRLDESDKTELINKVVEIMDSTDEYLHPDFSIERLAELAESKSKLVSQVINECRGCNFNSFVNEYRIREACRRISDIDRYGKLTLDAISKSVGFRARSSFFTAFKAVTGLPPSEFQKIARSEHK